MTAMKHQLKQIALIASMLSLASVLTGCGGFSTSRSVSPANFLIPGLVNDRTITPETLPDAEQTEPRDELFS